MDSERDEKLCKKTLAYLITMDVTADALHSLGSANTADSSMLASVVYDEVTATSKESKK